MGMGNLIVHNGTNLTIIVKVTKNCQPLAQVQEIKIHNGLFSDPIPLEQGVYEVIATSKLTNVKNPARMSV